MSNFAFSPVGSRIIVAGDIDSNRISGASGANFPVLIVPVQLDMSYPYQQAGYAIEMRELRCRVALEGAGYVTGIIPVPVRGRVTVEHREFKNQLVNMEIPFPYAQLALVERLRKSSDLQFRLALELLIDELVEIGRTKEAYASPIWGVKEHHSLYSDAHVVVPRTVWVERVLPQTGYGNVCLIELPVVPIDKCAGLKEAYDALHQAQELEKQGFYNEAVGKCRVALEPFFETIEQVEPDGGKKRIPVLKRSWQPRLGEATYNWLNSSFIATKEPMNKPHHSSSRHFDQLDAQLLLAVTTALIAYAVRTQSEATAF